MNNVSKLFLITSFMFVCISTINFKSVYAAEPVSEDKIYKSLTKKYRTRGLNLNKTTTDIGAEVSRISKKQSRGLKITIEDRAKIKKLVDENDLPSIDLAIYFEFDSDKVTQDSLPTLVKLGKALSRKELQGSKIMVAGHTDAKGSAEYNQELSKKRANAVKKFLMRTFNLNAKDMLAIGFGKEYLKKGIDPFSSQNRRVQVTNLDQ